MRSALHYNSATNDGSYPKIVFAEFSSAPLGALGYAPATWPDDRLSTPEGVFEAVIQNLQLLNRETLTIAQRNVNRSFSLLKRLATIRNFGTLIDLEITYWPDRFFALTGQIEELSRLSAKTLLDTLDAMTVAPVAQITACEPGRRH